MSKDVIELVACPVCQAGVPAQESTCWLCGYTIRGEEQPFRAPARSEDSSGLATTIVMVITVILVLGGVFAIAPGFGIALLPIIVPALIAVVVASRRIRRANKPLTAWQKVGQYLISFAMVVGIMLLMLVATIGALFVACLALITSSGW